MRKTTVQCSPCHCTDEHLLHKCISPFIKAWFLTRASCFLDLLLPPMKTLSSNSHTSAKRQRKADPQPTTRRGQLNNAHNAVATRDNRRTSSQLFKSCTLPVNSVPVTVLQIMPPQNGTGESSVAAFASLHSSSRILAWRRRDCKTQHLTRVGENYTS